MKVVTSNNNDTKGDKDILLPLTGTTADKLDKSNSKTFELSSNPGSQGAATFKATVRVLQGHEDLRSKIEWVKDTEAVLEGTNTTTLTPARNIVKAVLGPVTHNYFVAGMSYLASARSQTEM